MRNGSSYIRSTCARRSLVCEWVSALSLMLAGVALILAPLVAALLGF